MFPCVNRATTPLVGLFGNKNASYFSAPFLGSYTIPLTANSKNSQYFFFSLCTSSVFDILRDPYGECAALNNWITGYREIF